MEKLTKENKVSAVCNLDIKKYLGVWFEIGKYFTQEQNGFDNVTAVYTSKGNGKIRVRNEGYKNGKKRGITGSAWLINSQCTGALYVRFFWPFKSEYNVIKVAADYRYAVVMGESKNSLWILSRSPKMDLEDYQDIIKFLDKKGFDIQKLTLTNQDKNM